MVENYQNILKLSLQESIHELSSKYGDYMHHWEWGKVHKLLLKHPMGSVNILARLFKLNSGPYPVGGTYHTVAPYSFAFGDLFDVAHGASERHIYSLGNWDESKTVIPTGTSGIPASPYYCDQSELYVNNLYHNDYVSKDIIEKTAKYKMIIKPGE